MDSVEVLREYLVTGRDTAQLPGNGRAELVAGKSVMPMLKADRHGAVELNIGAALKVFTVKEKKGRVRSGNVGFFDRARPEEIFGLDVLYISDERYAQRTSSEFLDIPPDLVVEVISPDERWSSVMHKLDALFKAGVVRIWAVDLDSESVYVFRSLTDAKRYTKGTFLTEEDLLPGFAITVEKIFSD